MEQATNLLQSEIFVDEPMQVHLKETAGWAKFFGIVGFVFSGIFLLFGIVFFFQEPNSFNSYNTLMGLFYSIFAVVGCWVSLYTYRFGTKTNMALQSVNQDLMNHAFLNLKYVFRFYGVFVIIGVTLFIIAIMLSFNDLFN